MTTSCLVQSPPTGPHCYPGADSGFQCPHRWGPGDPLDGDREGHCAHVAWGHKPRRLRCWEGFVYKGLS